MPNDNNNFGECPDDDPLCQNGSPIKKNTSLSKKAGLLKSIISKSNNSLNVFYSTYYYLSTEKTHD